MKLIKYIIIAMVFFACSPVRSKVEFKAVKIAPVLPVKHWG